jgi:hypothetical protein
MAADSCDRTTVVLVLRLGGQLAAVTAERFQSSTGMDSNYVSIIFVFFWPILIFDYLEERKRMRQFGVGVPPPPQTEGGPMKQEL